MTTFPNPIVIRSDDPLPGAPVVILFHGRGGNELDMASLSSHFPANANYHSVRAPIAEAGGYAWFANRGIGRPVADSLSATMRWFRTWLDATFEPERPIIVLGFSGGAAFAGGLLLSDPERFAGAALLFGTLPFGADLPTHPLQLSGVPVLLIHGATDGVIPPDLQSATWEYLVDDSGASVSAYTEPGGHELTDGAMQLVSDWLSERFERIIQRTQIATNTHQQ